MAWESLKKKDIVNCIKHVENLLRWIKTNKFQTTSLLFSQILLGRGVRGRVGSHHQHVGQLLLLPWRLRLFLGLAVFFECAKEWHRFPLFHASSLLGAGLEQMECFSILFYRIKKKFRRYELAVNLHDKKGIDFNSSSQNYEILMDSLGLATPPAAILASFAWAISRDRYSGYKVFSTLKK